MLLLLVGCTQVTLVEQPDETCGDGVVDPTEECDDGNLEPGDGCDSGCRAEPVCGDGLLQEQRGEECDDGNLEAGDGCDPECSVEFCGDGLVQPLLDEECDDGGMIDEDGCSALCLIEECGDGVVQAGLGEECDDADKDPDDGCDDCRDRPLPPQGPCAAGTESVLANPDFETGDLAPWSSVSFDNGPPGEVVTDGCRSGDYCLHIDDNVGLSQTFDPPVPVVSLVSAEFWAWHDDTEWGMSNQWTYSDGTEGSLSSWWEDLDPLWASVDVLPQMDPTKSLTWFRTSGYRNGTPQDDVTRFDDFAFCVAR